MTGTISNHNFKIKVPHYFSSVSLPSCLLLLLTFPLFFAYTWKEKKDIIYISKIYSQGVEVTQCKNEKNQHNNNKVNQMVVLSGIENRVNSSKKIIMQKLYKEHTCHSLGCSLDFGTFPAFFVWLVPAHEALSPLPLGRRTSHLEE